MYIYPLVNVYFPNIFVCYLDLEYPLFLRILCGEAERDLPILPSFERDLYTTFFSTSLCSETLPVGL